jgi:hypothetical protein
VLDQHPRRPDALLGATIGRTAAVGTRLAPLNPVATVHGEENAWLRALVAKRATALAIYGGVLIVAVIGLAVHDGRLAIAVLVAALVFARKRGGLARRYRYATDGAAGELETAKMLALLPAGFTVVNDLEFQGFNVDHVVVGPTGVWVVETKSHAGVVEERADGVLLNGRAMFRDPRRQARACAADIAKLIERVTGRRRWIGALVCFPNATVTTKVSPADVSVVGGGQLLTRLRLGPSDLRQDERDRIVAVLKQAKRRGATGVLASPMAQSDSSVRPSATGTTTRR